MQRGEPVALFVSALYALSLAAGHIRRVRALPGWPIARDILPVLNVILAAHCGAHWFTVVSGVRPPKFLPSLFVAVALALPTALAKNERARRVIAGVTIIVLSFLALADALYFRFFGGIVPLLGASNAKQAWEVSSSIISLLSPRDAIFLALMASGAWVAAGRGESAAPASLRATRVAFVATLAVTVLGMSFVTLDVRAWLADTYSTRILSWRQRVHQTGLFGSHVRDAARIVRQAKAAGLPLPPARVRALERYLEGRSNGEPAELFGVARGKNLLIVQLEAMQQWVLDTCVNGVEITPFLNRLRRERALYFSGVWDQTMISPTADAEFLVLNSLHPMPDSAVVFQYSSNDFVALPSLLSRAGYSTLSAHAFERGFWNRATIHPRYGFRQSFFDRELGRDPKIGWGLGDKEFLSRALERVDSMRQPFMAFLITLTSHHPYNYLPAAESHMNVSGLPDMLAGYVQSMRYVDEALAAFFELLAKRAYVEDTVIVLYGDHESKIALDRTAEARAAEVLSLDAQTVKDIAKRSVATRKVPLLIVLPGATEGRTIDKVGGQIDISPTLLHLFGLEKPKSMIGTPLFGSGGAVFRADGSSVEGDRVRLPDGDCRTISGTDLPVGACEHLATRGDEQLRNSWAITQHNLAVSLSSGRSARR